MKYNYIVSIFLLIFVIIISQCIYVHNNKIIEGAGRKKKKKKGNKKKAAKKKAAIKPAARKRAARKRAARRPAARKATFAMKKFNLRMSMLRAMMQARLAAQFARARYLALLSQFVNSRQTPYVNLLGQAYVNSQTQTNLIAYQEAAQIDALASQTNPCNSDNDIAKIFDLTLQILSGGGQNSTKVYFISEIILKGLGHFYVYNIKNNETQFNYLSVQFPKTFKDDNAIKKKYYKFISLLALGHVSKSTTSTSLPPASNYFLQISSPIIKETRTIIDDLKSITYNLSAEEKAEIQNKYKTIVK